MHKKAITLLASLLVSGMAFAGLTGEWHMIEDGKPKAVVTISESGGVYTGVVTEGITEKAKTYVGTRIITGLKAESDEQFGGGKITDPRNGKVYELSAQLNGNTLHLEGGYKIFGKVRGKSQTWQKK